MPNIVRKSVPLTVRKGADGKDEIVITTVSPDRGGDRVFPDGAKLENYNRNPVIMWLHDYHGFTPAAGIPIGKNSYFKVTEEGIVAGPPIFLEGDPFADRVKNAWDKGFIRTASIGFAPLEEPSHNEFGGYDYHNWEMLEWSLVPIPMNADALRVAKTMGFEDLVAPRRSQGEIKDELDYTLSMIKEWNFNPENQALVKAIRDELVKRFPGSDTPVNIKALSAANRALIAEAIEICNKAEALCKGHHQTHNAHYKELVAGIGECRTKLQSLGPGESEEEKPGEKPEEKPEDENAKLLGSFFKK